MKPSVHLPPFAWLLPALLLPLSRAAGAEIFTAPKPSVTTYSAQLLISAGVLAAFVLLAFLFLRKRNGRRFSFSLRWLFVFCLACSLMVWGGVRWHVALGQLQEYNKALAFRRQLETPVSFQFQYMPINDLPDYLSTIGHVRVEASPSRPLDNISPMTNGDGLLLYRERTLALSVFDMKFENAVSWAAKLAGAQCEVRRTPETSAGYTIVLVPAADAAAASKPLSSPAADDVEAVRRKLNTFYVSLESTHSNLEDMSLAFASQSFVSVIIDPKVTHRSFSIQARHLNAQEVLQTILKKTRCEYEIRDEAIYIFERAADLPDEPNVAELKAKLAKPVSVDFSNTPLDKAAKELAELANVEIAFYPQFAPEFIKAKRITMRTHDMSARNTLNWMTHCANLQYSYIGRTLFIVPIGDSEDYPSKAEWALAEQQNAEVKKKLKDCKVSFEFKDKPLYEALDYICKSAGVSILLDPKLIEAGTDKSPINLRVMDMDAELALKWVLKLAELEYYIRDQAIFAAIKADI